MPGYIAKLFKNKEFFSAGLLIFVVFATYQIAWFSLSFKNNFDKYSIILALGGLFLLLKSFIYNFNAIQEVTKLGKSFLLVLDISFFAAQIWLVFAGVQYLTTSGYPAITLMCFAFASTIFYFQTFLLPKRQLGKISLFVTIFYWLSAALLYQSEWVNYSPQIFILSLYFFSLVIFISEAWLFFRSARIHFEK